MKTIKTEDFVFNNKTYTTKVWQDLENFIIQTFLGEVPISYQIWLNKIQADDMRFYYSADPIDMMMKNVKRFVEEFERLTIEKSELNKRIPVTA
jgi:hypothetical protein